MNPIVMALLALISAAPTLVSEIKVLWDALRLKVPGVDDQAVIDQAILAMDTKVDTDVRDFDAAADAKLAGA